MELGAFSVSLAVKNLQASKEFYEKLGHYSRHVIGLFQGMFEQNILTFNPGWDQAAQPLDTFTDVRELQRKLKEDGLELVSEADETTSGPASFMLLDPDGNPVLVDQHV